MSIPVRTTLFFVSCLGLALIACETAEDPEPISAGSSALTSVTAEVGPAGGTLIAGALELDIPAGALGSQTEITLTDLQDGHAVVAPEGLALDSPATLTWQLTPAPEDVPLDGLDLYVSDAAGTTKLRAANAAVHPTGLIAGVPVLGRAAVGLKTTPLANCNPQHPTATDPTFSLIQRMFGTAGGNQRLEWTVRQAGVYAQPTAVRTTVDGVVVVDGFNRAPGYNYMVTGHSGLSEFNSLIFNFWGSGMPYGPTEVELTVCAVNGKLLTSSDSITSLDGGPGLRISPSEDGAALHLGDVSEGQTATQALTVTNELDRPIQIQSSPEGYSLPNELQPGQSAELTFSYTPAPGSAKTFLWHELWWLNFEALVDGHNVTFTKQITARAVP